MTTATQTIPAGYKQTEIGMIPTDWDVKRLGDIAQFNNGKAHERFIDDKGNYVVVNSKFISTEGEVFKTSDKNLSPLFEGEIVMVMSDIPHGRALAKCFFIRENGKYTLNQRICSFKPINADSLYLFYKLNRNKYFLDFDSGVGQTNLRRIEVLDCPIALPSNKKEQSAISTALSDADALIVKMEALIQKKKNIKQGVMQELLTGKRRLPGFSGKWEVKKVGDFFSLSATYSKSSFVNDGGTYLIMDMGSVSSEGKNIASKRISLSTDLLRTGDLVMPKDDIGGGNIIGKVAYIDADNKYILGDHVYKLTAKNSEVDALFFSYLMNSNGVSIKLKKKVAGSAQLGLGRKSVEDQDIDFPKDKSEQIAIATTLSDMDTEIEKLESQLTKYQNLKQGMMQTLLTGKIRLLTK